MATKPAPSGPPPVRTFDKTFDPPRRDKPVSVVLTFPGITMISRDPGRRDTFFDLVQKSESDIDYSELLFASGAIDHSTMLHLQRHWFGKGPGSSGDWFPESQPIKQKFRDNMTQAFDLSKARNRPVVVFWVVPTEHVYVTLKETDTEIVLFRFTPMPPSPARR
jgi:hypothetical protein